MACHGQGAGAHGSGCGIVILPYEIEQAMSGTGPVRALVEHYQLGGFHANVLPAERKRFLRWLAERQVQTMPSPAVPVCRQLDLLEAAQPQEAGKGAAA